MMVVEGADIERIEVELERQDPRRVARGKGSFQRRTAMNTRKEPAMATTPESFVDALNAAFGKQTTQRSARREQLQVRQRKGRRDDWALSADSRRRPTFLVEGRDRQGGGQLSRRRDSPARCSWSGPIQGGAAARSAGRQDR